MRHHSETSTNGNMLSSNSIFREQEQEAESKNTDRLGWASITRASVFSDDDDDLTNPAKSFTGKVMLYAEDSLMQLNMCCSAESHLLEDGDVEVSGIVAKATNLSLHPIESQMKNNNSEVRKIIDKDSVEVALENNPSSQSSATAPNEVFYQEEVREAVDDGYTLSANKCH